MKKYGNVVKYNGLLNRPSILVADPKIIQEITANDGYDFIKPINMMANFVAIIGRGILLSEGESHRRQRKMMNPAFAYHNIKVIIFHKVKNIIEFN